MEVGLKQYKTAHIASSLTGTSEMNNPRRWNFVQRNLTNHTTNRGKATLSVLHMGHYAVDKINL